MGLVVRRGSAGASSGRTIYKQVQTTSELGSEIHLNNAILSEPLYAFAHSPTTTTTTSRPVISQAVVHLRTVRTFANCWRMCMCVCVCSLAQICNKIRVYSRTFHGLIIAFSSFSPGRIRHRSGHDRPISPKYRYGMDTGFMLQSNVENVKHVFR